VSPSDPVPVDAVPVSRVAALGGGLIGQSWTALFLAAGRSVALFDPDPAAETRVRNAVEDAWPVLAVADEVTLSNDEDGVAVYLDRLLSR